MRAFVLIVLLGFAIASSASSSSDYPDFPEPRVRIPYQQFPNSSFGPTIMMGLMFIFVFIAINWCGLRSRRIPNVWKQGNILKRMQQDERRKKRLEKSDDEGEVYEKVFDNESEGSDESEESQGQRRDLDSEYHDAGFRNLHYDNPEDLEQLKQMYPDYYKYKQQVQQEVLSTFNGSTRAPPPSPSKTDRDDYDESDERKNRRVTRSMTRHDE